MDTYTSDLIFCDPNKYICTDPACNDDCGADNHPVNND